jgi:hypothetical protein
VWIACVEDRGTVYQGVIEIHCRLCSDRQGRRVYHRWHQMFRLTDRIESKD